MSQDHLTRLVSVGDENGVGKGHVYYTFKNKKQVQRKLEFNKFNPIAKKHVKYVEKKK